MYIGRFAPSPTGPLHEGSLVAALASWLDARAHEGKWLVRIEDVDTPRTVKGAAEEILRQLHALSLVPDELPVWQSTRSAHYETALQVLRDKQLLYRCNCSRKDIQDANAALGITHTRNADLRYPGMCRHHIDTGIFRDTHYSLRVLAEVNYPQMSMHGGSMPETAHNNSLITWQDRRLGTQQQNVQETVGDFVLKRADGCVTYQLAVVVDDALQGITHVVRGEDLADNTARQILLQLHLGYATPSYLHMPLVLAADGEKLSKQNGAEPINTREPVAAISSALARLGLQNSQSAANNGSLNESLSETLNRATKAWRARPLT
jgi:glutamyl-Q tRNA(Asp) synthetase